MGPGASTASTSLTRGTSGFVQPSFGFRLFDLLILLMNLTVGKDGEVVNKLEGCFVFSFAYSLVGQHEALTDPCLMAASTLHRVGAVALRMSVILAGQYGFGPPVELLAPDGF